MEPVSNTPNVAAPEPAKPSDHAPPLIQADGPSQSALKCDPYLLTFLADRDLPCPNCTYNLRGLRGSVCPECSQELKLAVGLVEPKLGAWLAGVLGLAVGAGFSLMMVGYLLFQTMLRGRGPFENSQVTFVIILPAVFMSACLLTLLRHRGRFRKYPVLIRIGLAVACWLLTLANLTVFSLVIR